MSSSLPSHTNQIMDAFLINNKSQISSKYEQRKHAEQQKAILSSLKRPQSIENNQKEIQPFWPTNINDTNSSLGSEQQYTTNQYNPTRNERQSSQNTTTANQQHRAIHQQEEIQPLIQSRQSSPQLRQNSPTVQKNSTNCRSDVGKAWAHQTAAPKSKEKYQPLYTQTTIDEEDDIVCCDFTSTDGHWREGTKNICTISLWALIAFAILNRLFVHMNISMHHKVASSVSPKDVGVVPAATVPETAQVVFDEQEVAETTQSDTRVIDGKADTDPNNRVIDGNGDIDSNSILSNQIAPEDANVEVAPERPVDDEKRIVETTQIDGNVEQYSSNAISNQQRPKLRIWDNRE